MNDRTSRELVSHTDARLDHFEERLNTQGQEISSLVATVNGFGRQIDRVSQTMDSIANRVNKEKPVNWGWLASGVALAVTFTTMVTAPLYKSDQDIKAELRVSNEKMYSHLNEGNRVIGEHNAQLDDHHEWIIRLSERVKKNGDSVARFDGILQGIQMERRNNLSKQK